VGWQAREVALGLPGQGGSGKIPRFTKVLYGLDFTQLDKDSL